MERDGPGIITGVREIVGRYQGTEALIGAVMALIETRWLDELEGNEALWRQFALSFLVKLMPLAPELDKSNQNLRVRTIATIREVNGALADRLTEIDQTVGMIAKAESPDDIEKLVKLLCKLHPAAETIALRDRW